MSDIVVHGVPGSPYVRTVLMALEEKRQGWQLQSLAMGGNRTVEYRAIHPFEKIPTINHADFHLYETIAILEYVDRLASDPPLRPSETRSVARMYQVISIVNAYVAPRVSGAVTFPFLVAPRFGIPVDEDAAREAVPGGKYVIDELARLLGNNEYMAGSTITLADLMLIPHLAFLADFPEGEAILGTHATLRAWVHRIKARPSFTATDWQVLLQRFPMPVATRMNG